MTMTDAEVAAIEKLLCPPTVACLECPPFHRLIAEIRRLRAVEEPTSQSLREKLLACCSLLEVRQVIEDELPEGGPPSAQELKPGEAIVRDWESEEILLIEPSAGYFDVKITHRWPARKP